MERIRKGLRDAERECGTISKEFIGTFIDKIYVTPEGDNISYDGHPIYLIASSQQYGS